MFLKHIFISSRTPNFVNLYLERLSSLLLSELWHEIGSEHNEYLIFDYQFLTPFNIIGDGGTGFKMLALFF